MSQSPGRDEQRSYRMPDLPGDPYGRDTDLYPPVPEFPRYDFWEESNFDANFQRDDSDTVVHDRFSELPAVAADQRHAEDRVAQPPVRRRRGHELRVVQPQRLKAQTLHKNAQDIDRPSPSSRPAVRLRRDQVTGTTLRTSAMTGDMVTGTRPAPQRRSNARSQRRSRGGNPAWKWQPIVMPSLRLMLEQAFPTLVMAMSLLLGLLVIDRAPFLEGAWAPIVLAPSLALFFLADKQVRPMWRRCAVMNLAAVGVFYPLLIVRQSYLRVPYVEWGNGTLAMPLAATLTVVLLLVAMALIAAWMSQDDPEYAGVLFLPAALLVPFFAGATEIVSLRTALIIAATVFMVSSVLTIVASMLPGAYPMLVAPVALALEFMVLPLSDSVPIFPMGAGTASKLLFFVVLATTVGLTASMPSMAGWVRQVRDLVHATGVEPAR